MVKEKRNYTPREVAGMCEAYLRFKWDGLGNVKEVNRYLEIVPENVRKIILFLDSLPLDERISALDKLR
ncbi:hypothetical protein J4225_03795 [Candidatus Pacearchaeota archaeon]|nr:hypothetical protein [Candidatus Pacearchaeota archaeon]